jgi:hypothetical protein
VITGGHRAPDMYVSVKPLLALWAFTEGLSWICIIGDELAAGRLSVRQLPFAWLGLDSRLSTQVIIYGGAWAGPRRRRPDYSSREYQPERALLPAGCGRAVATGTAERSPEPGSPEGEAVETQKLIR